MATERLIIGVDPDVDKSGIAVLNDIGVYLYTWPLWKFFSEIGQEYYRNAHVVIEAGWANKRGLSFSQSPMRAVRTGMNHAIGMQIEAFCKTHEIEYELFVPTARTPKWTHEMMCKLTGIHVRRSNQDERDALRAVYFSTRGKEMFK